jgi:hypothetical protein
MADGKGKGRMTLPFLAVKDFDKHQHYRDRRPPWIKLYAALLTDAAFLMLPEAAQAQLVKLWVLASQFGNPLPNQPRLLAGKIGTTKRFYLPELIASGFLIPCEQDASSPLAESSESASAPVRVAREVEDRGQRTESSSSSLTDSAVKLISMLGDTDHAERTVAAFLAGLPSDAKRHSWTLSLIAGLEGIGGPLILAGPLLDGMADFNLADRQQFPYNAAVFRAFVDRAAKPKLERSPRPGTTAAQRTAANGLEALKDIA